MSQPDDPIALRRDLERRALARFEKVVSESLDVGTVVLEDEEYVRLTRASIHLGLDLAGRIHDALTDAGGDVRGTADVVHLILVCEADQPMQFLRCETARLHPHLVRVWSVLSEVQEDTRDRVRVSVGDAVYYGQTLGLHRVLEQVAGNRQRRGGDDVLDAVGQVVAGLK